MITEEEQNILPKEICCNLITDASGNYDPAAEMHYRRDTTFRIAESGLSTEKIYRIGQGTYVVRSFFSTDNKRTMQDNLLRILDTQIDKVS